MVLNWRKSTRSSGNGGNCVEVARVLTNRDTDQNARATNDS
jgi:hypothetical protein